MPDSSADLIVNSEPAEPPDFRSLMAFVPEATRAAYLGTTALMVGDFELR